MDPANLTRAAAAARAHLITAVTNEVMVGLSGRAPAGQPHPAPADTILDATLDGVPVDAAQFDGARLPVELTDGTHELEVTALHRFSRSGQGMHRFVDVDDRVYLYTQFEPADARRVFACFEQPDLKARFTISVIAPHDWLVLSNSADAEPARSDDDFARWDFAPTQPLPTYLTAIVAGHYHRVPTEITGAAGRIPASVLCCAALANVLVSVRIMAITYSGVVVFV